MPLTARACSSFLKAFRSQHYFGGSCSIFGPAFILLIYRNSSSSFHSMKQLKLLCYSLLCSAIFSAASAQPKQYAKYVNPFIGTGGHGHTFPGATVPFGMVQLSPDTRIDGSWDGCGGYHYNDSVIYGFSHTHLSGTGVSDYGDIAVLPFTRYKGDDENSKELDYKKYAAGFSHKNEAASAGYYRVKLDNNVTAELTATTRVGLHQYTFPAGEVARLIIQADHRDKTLESEITVVGSNCLEGIRRSEAWATDQHIYYVMEFSKPFSKNMRVGKGSNDGKPFTAYCQLNFGKLNGKPLLVRVGISTVSIEGARKNLQAELPNWDFNKVRKDAEAMWNKELSRVEVAGTQEQLAIFYTALYHTMLQPNVSMDVDGMYRGRDNNIHKAEGFTNHTVFSLWDTFRGAHPLYTLLQRGRTADFINTFNAQYEQGGRLPVWELASNETDCMIGYHSVSVIADAMLKGITGFDYNKAFEASKHSAMLDIFGLKAYKQNGFISLEDEHESVSKNLEYAYDDWCIAQMAQLLHKTDDYKYFMRRSQSWKNMLDAQTTFMRPRRNGGWLSPFDPREVNNHFTEGNSWQYTFFVPQDVNGLMERMGGTQSFEKKLDELFTTTSETTGREQADITGLIGQYAHGNEPSHHMIYLYDFAGKPYKAQQLIHHVLTDFYKNAPDGLIGNEDCGQMSAWFVLSSLGIYQVTPGSPYIMLGTPLFSRAVIHLENGKTFTITAPNISPANYYIASVQLNGMPHPASYITYNDIMAGGTLAFTMASKPEQQKEAAPPPADVPERILSVPAIDAKAQVFDDSLQIEMVSNELNANTGVYYRLDKKTDTDQPNAGDIKYTHPFFIHDNKTIVASSGDKERHSPVVTAHFFRRPNNWTITIHSKYSPQYTAGGDKGIIDGIRGDSNWRKGDWQGYQSQDFECVVDLQKPTTIQEFNAGFLQDTRAWILMPTKVEYYTSNDNSNFTLAATVQNEVDAKDYRVQTKDLAAHISPTTARYVKVKAYNYGLLPAWHQGAGGGAYIFVDEVEVR